MRKILTKPVTWIVAVIVVAGLGVGLALFEPWRAFTSSQLYEPVPAAAPAEAETGSEAQTASPSSPSASSTPAPPKPIVLADGAFTSQEHDTSGRARVLELSDGTRTLRLENFSTSDGPDVHVWLSEATAGGDWNKFDDGRFVALGEIKATDGSHNYDIPAEADLDSLRSVVIWCDRFDVAFGSAPLAL